MPLLAAEERELAWYAWLGGSETGATLEVQVMSLLPILQSRCMLPYEDVGDFILGNVVDQASMWNKLSYRP
jgi:hypothetical protein